jgi:putative SOS response-associated peptidase YedK
MAVPSSNSQARNRFTLNSAPFLAIAGIWREGAGNHLPACTMLMAPAPDVELHHNRQVGWPRPEDWAAWIYLAKPGGEILRLLMVANRGNRAAGNGLTAD